MDSAIPLIGNLALMKAANLVLGGHSFISQLGNDPAPTSDEAREIVETCLNTGITWFDTTYAPERTALGRTLHELGRRQEANIIAWNFFEHFGPEDCVSGHAPYNADHIRQMLDELRTDTIDLLIVHPVEDQDSQRRQESIASEWREKGYVKALGTWMPNLSDVSDIYEVAVSPYNVTTHHQNLFAQYKAKGWQTFATSPFVRGWELDNRVRQSQLTKDNLADLMLRYSAFADNVDHLIVSMRRNAYVHINSLSIAKGPLNSDERRLLD
jgi:aryl-alcohol dehydrogenase-like predicted oxidoreductase